MVEEFQVDFFDQKDTLIVVDIIRRNMQTFSDSNSILPATLRRLNNLYGIYSQGGCFLFVAKQKKNNLIIGCAGLGPFHGLPLSEAIGEVRDLVVEERFRGQGVGSKLLHRCLHEAKKTGYHRLYLEASSQMTYARKLFLRTGFRPVSSDEEEDSLLPCYFLMENLWNKDF